MYGRHVSDPPPEKLWVLANISAAWASQSCRIFENVFLQQCFPVLSFFIGKITCENKGDSSVTWPTVYMRKMEPSPAVLTQNKWGVQDRPCVSAGEFFSSPAKHTLWSDSTCCCVTRENTICHSWWQPWVCVYTLLLLFSWNVHCFAFCCLSVCLICWIFPSFSWGEMFSLAHSSYLGKKREWEQLRTWIIWINVIEKKSGIGMALGMSGVNPRRIRCSAWISSEIMKCYLYKTFVY